MGQRTLLFSALESDARASSPTSRKSPTRVASTPRPPAARGLATASGSTSLQPRAPCPTHRAAGSEVVPASASCLTNETLQQPASLAAQSAFGGGAGKASWIHHVQKKAFVGCPASRTSVEVELGRRAAGERGKPLDATIQDGHAGKHPPAGASQKVRTYGASHGPLQSVRTHAAIHGDGDWRVENAGAGGLAGKPTPWEVNRKRGSPRPNCDGAAGWPTHKRKPLLGEKLEESASREREATYTHRRERRHPPPVNAPFWEERSGSSPVRPSRARSMDATLRSKAFGANTDWLGTTSPRGKKHFYKEGEGVSAPYETRVGAIVFGTQPKSDPLAKTQARATSPDTSGMSSKALAARKMWASVRAQDDEASSAVGSWCGMPMRLELTAPARAAAAYSEPLSPRGSRRRAQSARGSRHRERSAR